MTKVVFIGLLATRMALPSFFDLGNSGIAEASSNAVFLAYVSSNSQKMALLEAPMNPSAGQTFEPSSSIDNNALVSVPEVSGTPGSSPISPSSSPESNKIITYKVKAGDTVSGIAQKFNISINTVIWGNNLKKSSTLTVGQTLTILPISGVRHIVVSRDTLQSIALKYKGDIQEVLAYNDLSAGDKLKIGDVIMVPDGEITTPTISAPVKVVAKTSIAKKVASVALGVGIASADSGYYMRPITSGVRTQGIHGNNGVDLADACGTPIYASAEGDVVIAKNNGGYNGGYGNYVVINHSNGSQTLYAHMQSVVTTEGAHISQGENIGMIGATGKVHGVTGCHVHFEIRNGPSNPF